MKDPHNYRGVGYSMIVVSASLATIAILALFLADDVLFSDNMQRAKTAQFEACREVNFVGEECAKWVKQFDAETCIAERDLESPECYQYRTWIQSDIFEECRANRDNTSPQCMEYGELVFSGLVEKTEE